ncbi:MAG: YjbH domain-containing protein [Bacteroidota bacterium]
MDKKIGFYFTICLFLAKGLSSQSLTGITGLMNAPSANFEKDGTFYMGANFINKEYIKTYTDGQFDCIVYYFDLTFLPFLEINYRNTRMLGNSNDHHHTVDRSFSGKFRLLKERKYLPAIAIGANDPATTANSGNQYFSAAYIVASKNFEWRKNRLGGTLGWAYPAFRNNLFAGLFGGVTFNPAFYKQLTFMAEYDSRTFNVGASVFLFKHLYLFALLQGMRELGGGLSFKMRMYSGFKGMLSKKEFLQ